MLFPQLYLQRGMLIKNYNVCILPRLCKYWIFLEVANFGFLVDDNSLHVLKLRFSWYSYFLCTYWHIRYFFFCISSVFLVLLFLLLSFLVTALKTILTTLTFATYPCPPLLLSIWHHRSITFHFSRKFELWFISESSFVTKNAPGKTLFVRYTKI